MKNESKNELSQTNFSFKYTDMASSSVDFKETLDAVNWNLGVVKGCNDRLHNDMVRLKKNAVNFG